MGQYKSPLHQTVSTTPTDFWNDSCSIEELTYAIEHGAVGATSNPAIVLEVLRKEMPLWKERLGAIIEELPTGSEVDVTWKLIEEMAVRAAALLVPVFALEGGRKGRLSVQTNPTLFRNAWAMADQAQHLHGLAPNLQVKLPATRAGVAAIEEATYRGVNINATVCFTVPQALLVGEAVERGLRRREAEGRDVAGMSPVCTLMVGRLDDWLAVLAERDGIIASPGYHHWAGIACIKKAYGVYRKRGYRTRLLAAAYRHHLHWSELIGGDLILTIPYVWQKRFNASAVEVRPRFDEPVDEKIVRELSGRFPDFRRAYAEDGLGLDELDSFGATRRTLRTFIKAYSDLLALVRDFMIPDPDRRPA
jgi:transaldolase